MNKDLLEFEKEITEYIFLEEEPQKSDIIFIPGNGYPQMAEHAAALWKAGYAPFVMPSGKYSISTGKFSGHYEENRVYQGNYKTEWEFLTEVLIQNGVPEKAILKEDQSTYTYENALFSKACAEKADLSIQRSLICCKSHHARRCKLYYEVAFPDSEIRILPTNVDGVTKENWMHSQKGIDEVLGEVQRIIQQFNLIM